MKLNRSQAGLAWRVAVALAAGGIVVLGWASDSDSGPGSSQGSRQAYSFELVRTVDEDAATRARLTELIRQAEAAARAGDQDGDGVSIPAGD